MMHLTLAAVPFVMKIVVAVWAIVAVLLVLVVLIQKGRGGGLASAFGGLGTSLLGTKTGDFLTWFTICLVCVWLVLSVVAVKWFKPTASQYLQIPTQQQQLPPGQTGTVPPPPAQQGQPEGATQQQNAPEAETTPAPAGPNAPVNQ
jgi:preprotein translocase subunit SecG